MKRARADTSPRRRMTEMARISRQAYAEMFGPTKGDMVRLGDTTLLAEVGHD